MKDIKSTILLLIIIGLAGYNIFFTKQLKTDVAGYNAKIDSIQTEIDSVETVNKQLDEHIFTIHKEIVNINKDINQVENKITTIKEKTNEKVNHVDNYVIHDLDKFFADRYENQTRLDSTAKSSNSKTRN